MLKTYESYFRSVAVFDLSCVELRKDAISAMQSALAREVRLLCRHVYTFNLCALPYQRDVTTALLSRG